MKNPPGNYYPIHEHFHRDLLARDESYSNFKNTKMTTFLAIDPGMRNFAACIIHYQEGAMRIHTTKFLLPEFKKTYSTITYLRWVLSLWVVEVLRKYSILFVRNGLENIPKSIIFDPSSYDPTMPIMIKESIAHASVGGVADAGRVQHMLESFCDDFSIPWLDVSPMSMRSYIGSKDKSDTKLKVYQKFHVEFPSEDECDVFAIGMTGIAILKGEYVVKKKK